MKFYGLEKSVRKWKEIIESEFGVTCSKVTTENDRSVDSFSFSAELTPDNRDHLQDNYWHKIEDGHTAPWNWRIAYLE